MTTIREAAAELGWTGDELFMQLLDDGLVLPHPSGVGYVVAPHPEGLKQVDEIVHKDMLFSAWVADGELTLVSTVLKDDTDPDLAVVWDHVGDRRLGPDATEANSDYLYGRARVRVWR